MADIADDALELIDKTVELGVAQIPRYTGISAFECEECSEEIPEGRRNAVNGVKLCTECGDRAELKAQGVRRG